MFLPAVPHMSCTCSKHRFPAYPARYGLREHLGKRHPHNHAPRRAIMACAIIRSAWTTNAGWWRLEGRKTAFPVKGAVLEYAVGCRMVHKDLIYEILSVVEEIPEGCVATYGQIARLIGRDKNSRLVGKVLSMAEYYGDYPCHRVVNHAGRLVPGWLEQRLLLEAEQVGMKDDSHVDLKKCQWDY